MKVLLVYYSFTGQAQRAVTEVVKTLEADGHAPALCRVDFADPAARPKRPLSWAQISALGKLSSEGVTVDIVAEPASALDDSYDLVLLFTNTWSFSPCAPIQSFLKSPAAQRVMTGKACAVYVVCRGFWRANLKKTRPLVEAAGARIIGAAPFVHCGFWLGSTLRIVDYMMSDGPPHKTFRGWYPLPKFGLSPRSIRQLAPFTRKMLTAAAKASQATPR